MSTDSDNRTDAQPTFEPREGEHVSDHASAAESAGERSLSADDDRSREAWKTDCRECSELVPAKPYCYERGTARPADGDFCVGEEDESR